MKVVNVIKGLVTGVVVIALLVGFYGTIFWLLDKSARERAAWPTVIGTITGVDSHVAEVLDDGDYSYVIVDFDYEVNGTRFHARQKWPVSDRAAQSPAAAYPPGTAVTAHYNPAEPSKAVVKPDALYSEWIDVIEPGLLGLILIFGISVKVVGKVKSSLRRRREGGVTRTQLALAGEAPGR